MLGVGLAFFAGLCAASVSLCGKLAFSSHLLLRDFLCTWSFQEHLMHCEKLIVVARVLLFLSMFLFNGLMWTLFVKAMRSSSSAKAMVTNTASNFIFSAMFGKLLFGEMLSMQWYIGAFIIILGLFMINKNKKDSEHLLELNKDVPSDRKQN